MPRPFCVYDRCSRSQSSREFHVSRDTDWELRVPLRKSKPKKNPKMNFVFLYEWKFGRTRNTVGTRAAGECFHSFFEFSQTFTSVCITR